MVRLITHNLLACHAKGCTSNNFPLRLKDVSVEIREAEFNVDFVRNFVPRIEWRALVDTAKEVRMCFQARRCTADENCFAFGTSLYDALSHIHDVFNVVYGVHWILYD